MVNFRSATTVFTSRAAGLSQLGYGLILIAIILLEPHGITALVGRIKQRLGAKQAEQLAGAKPHV